MRIKQRLLRVLEKKGAIKNYNDVCGDDGTSILFPIILKNLGFLLDEEKEFKITALKARRSVNTIVRIIGPLFFKTRQIIIDKGDLVGGAANEEPMVAIPSDKPIVFASNHGFRDDILGTITAVNCHAYIMFASLPQFFNTIHGPLLNLNGVVLVNRKVKKSKQSSVRKAVQVLSAGCNLIMFPEGVWNKSPNLLALPLWNGVYRIAKQSDAIIVPVVHYIKDPSYTIDDKDNPFYTVEWDPIDISKMTEQEALQQIRDAFSTATYLMMEKYGRNTRTAEIGDYTSASARWEEHLKNRASTADYYDHEIETSADYVPKNMVSPYEVFEPISRITLTAHNIRDVINASKVAEEWKKNDYQHNF